ncbi:MAG: hypothetical protein L6R39_007321, partial [Caloplaca ligustica]
MSPPGPQSALETLLVLKGFQTYGSGSPSLDSLSQTLKSHEIVHGSAAFGGERFEPKAIKTLYLRLLNEELKLESSKHDEPIQLQNDPLHPGKRKLSSPALETIEEAAQYRHLIPQLATKVYDGYRQSTVKAIEDEERNYRLLQKDIGEIERGEWDARLQDQDITPKRDSKGPSSIQTLLQDEPDSSDRPSKVANGTSSGPLPSIYQSLPTQRELPNLPTLESQPQAVPYVSGDQIAATSSAAAATTWEPTATAVNSPRRGQRPTFAPHEPPSTTSRPPSQPGSVENSVPFLPPPHNAQQGYHMSPPASDLHRRQSSHPTNIAPSPSSRPHQTPLPPPERSSGSPIILPPPPGMLRTASSSSGPLDALADMAGHQYRAGAASSPRPSQPSNALQHTVQLPLPSNYTQRGYQYPPYDSRMPYQNPYPPYQMPPYHPQHHPHASPYQHPTHTPGHSPHYAPRASYQPPVAAYPQYSHYSNTSPYPPHPVTPSYAPYPPLQALNQQTPISVPDRKKMPPKPSPINTSVASTKWKDTDLPGGLGSPKSPIQPRADEISPLSEKAPSPTFGSSRPNRIGTIAPGSNLTSATEVLPPPFDPPPKAKPRRGRPPRGASTRGRGNRAPSTASSVPRTRTRSASAISAADELSLETLTSAAVNRTVIKPEPPATPARDSSASVPPTITTIDNEANRKSTRHRRETLRGMESAASETPRPSAKRKRTNTVDASEIDQPLPRPPTIPSAYDKQKAELSTTHILASRNFPRTSATIINDISAHKFASLFAKPLTEREAPGYRSLIYRPQDLKSIKQAITNGNRALTAILDRGIDEPGDPAFVAVDGAGESDSRFWVKKNEDLAPPKGIVNSA